MADSEANGRSRSEVTALCKVEGVLSGSAPRGATWGAEVPGGVGWGACWQAVGGRVGV